MKKLIACTLALMLLLSACGGKTPETTAPTTEPAVETTVPTTAAPTEPTTAPTTAPTEPPVLYRNPLNGTPLDEPEDDRVFAVMINNHSAALPQSGVGGADIIYEILAEGGVTRFMALFTDPDDAGEIGPVRSLRPYYLNIMRGYNAIATSAGGSSEADDMVYNLGYNRVNGIAGTGAGYFYRDSWRRSNRGYEHSLMITGEDLEKAAEAMSFDTTSTERDYGLTFDDAPMTGGDAAGKIVVSFRSGGKTTTLTYSADDGFYTAYQQNRDFTDSNTDEKVPFENVLVLFAETSVTDNSGHLSVQTTGEGDGYLARDGKIISIRWSRDSETDHFSYTDESGNAVTFGVGKTYVAVVPTGSPVEYSD